MALFLKILNSVLILLVMYLGSKHGLAMLLGKPDAVGMFSRWPVGLVGIRLLGGLSLLAAGLTLFPSTFVWGNFLTAAVILLLIAFFLHERNWRGVATEMPFFLLSLLIIYLQHPLAPAR